MSPAGDSDDSSRMHAVQNTLGAGLASSPMFWTLIGGVVLASIAIWSMGLVKADGLAKNRRDVRAFPWWLWVAAAFIVYSGVIVGSSLARMALQGEQNEHKVRAITTAAGFVFAIVSGLVLMRVASDKSKRTGMQMATGDLRRGVVAFLIAVPFVLGTSVVSTMLYTKINQKAPDNAAHELLRLYRENPNDIWVWVLLGSAVLLAPVVEELMYRAFLQTGFLAATKRAWVAILGTSVLFTLAHIGTPDKPNVPWHALPTLFVLSLGMGVAFERSGRIGVPILMHVLFNASNVVIMVMSTKR
jgi:membrane protease YdiL (CAAX protease family)